MKNRMSAKAESPGEDGIIREILRGNPCPSSLFSQAERVAEDDLWESVLNMAERGNPQEVFRAAMLYEKACFKAPEAGAVHIHRLLELFIGSGNGSLHRHFSKSLYHILLADSNALDDKGKEALAERCFDLLVDEKVKVGVKMWCIQTLHTLSPQVSWIAVQLEDALLWLLDRPHTPGFASRAFKVLKSLRKR